MFSVLMIEITILPSDCSLEMFYSVVGMKQGWMKVRVDIWFLRRIYVAVTNNTFKYFEMPSIYIKAIVSFVMFSVSELLIP